MVITLAAKVRKIFNENGAITIREIQDLLSKDPEVKVPEKQLNHRVRSAIYSLRKGKEIIRVTDSTYKKA